MMRWNASFIRGLAQSVLDRARTIRSGLDQAPAAAPKRKRAPTARKKTTKRKPRA